MDDEDWDKLRQTLENNGKSRDAETLEESEDEDEILELIAELATALDEENGALLMQTFDELYQEVSERNYEEYDINEFDLYDPGNGYEDVGSIHEFGDFSSSRYLRDDMQVPLHPVQRIIRDRSTSSYLRNAGIDEDALFRDIIRERKMVEDN